MESQQPYRPPGARIGQRPGAPGSGAGAISPRILQSMEKTRPWVRLVAGMMIVGCLLLVLAALAMFVVGGIAGASSELGGLGGAALGGAYFLLALLYLFPALYLWRYAGAIKQIGRSNTAALEDALEHQASFWRFVGILTAVVVVIYVAIIGIAAIVAVIGAASSGS